MKNKSTRVINIVFFVALFIFLFLLAKLSPYCADDYYFQNVLSEKQSFAELFHYIVHFGNGRILANLLTFFLVSNSWLCATIKATVCSMIAFYAHMILSKQNSGHSLLFIVIAFALFPPRIVSQVFVWTSGFSNYLPPLMIFMVLYYSIVYGQHKNHILSVGLLFVVAFAGQLFVEHSAVISLFTISVLSVYLLKKKLNNIPEAISCLLGMITGAAVSFLIPRLLTIQTEWEGYQKLNLGSVKELLISVVSNGMKICKDFSKAFFFWILLSTSLLLFFCQYCKKISCRIVCAAFLYQFPVACIVFQFIAGLINDIWSGALISLSFLSWCIASFFVLFFSNENNKRKYSMIGLLLLALFAVTPLLIVYPIGQRCLAHSVLFFSILLCSLLSETARSKKARCFLGTIAAIIVLFVVKELLFISIVTNQQENYIRKQIRNGEDSISVPSISSPLLINNYNDMITYAYYRDVPGDISFTKQSYEEWLTRRDTENEGT